MNIMDSSPLAGVMKQSAQCGELKYDLSCELYRMSTFSTFPVNVPVSERRLARAGFITPVSKIKSNASVVA